MKLQSTKAILAMLILVSMSVTLTAQKIQYWRAWDKRGINVFEPSKKDTVGFDDMRVRIGGSFTQNFQRFTHSNKANFVGTTGNPSLNRNLLFGVIRAEDTTSATLSGFNLAMANLNIDIQIADGIRVGLENYMSSRHHSEFWVKGGYIQIDKLPMFGNPEWFTKYARVKIGHFQPNFGDFQFRRSDGGNNIFNPFVENLLLDAFTTEIGGEIYLFPTSELMVMGGMTSGFINGNNVKQPDAINNFGVVPTRRQPSIFAKVAYDKQFASGLRFRLSASIYNNSNIQRNTLFAGDRTGSQYFGVMDPAQTAGVNTTSAAQFTSGRIDPGVANRVRAINISPFAKYKGLEVYGGFDNVTGSAYSDTSARQWLRRTWNQTYGEVVYRFLKNEELYVGVRYVTATGQPSGMRYGTNGLSDAGKVANSQAEVTVNRLAVAAGYFPTKNMLLKVEYMNQNYTNYPRADYRHEGKITGLVVSAVIGF